MRGVTPCVVVMLVGAALMLGGAVAWATRTPTRSAHHAKPAIHAIVIVPARTDPVKVILPAPVLVAPDQAVMSGGRADT